MGVVYRRGHGGSLCVDAVTAAIVVGIALLLQFVFYLTVATACPVGVYSATGSAHRSGNITYVITVDNSNTIGLDMAAGDQALEQDQTQDQTLTQTQSQTGAATQNAPQRIRVVQSQDQEQEQSQTQRRSLGRKSFEGIGRRAEILDQQRQWTLPSMLVAPLDLSTLDWPSLDLSGVSLTLCPLLGRYLGY